MPTIFPGSGPVARTAAKYSMWGESNPIRPAALAPATRDSTSPREAGTMWTSSFWAVSVTLQYLLVRHIVPDPRALLDGEVHRAERLAELAVEFLIAAFPVDHVGAVIADPRQVLGAHLRHVELDRIAHAAIIS